ncbi:MAG: cysteine peptidase family C39 domain-containing protein [Acidobacteria bacterium]|nr:cysteine peptidase family C39 domain-containing protein [Acidobacteriota bacterium]
MRARGWFFADVEIFPYDPVGAVFGQGARDSCVAACCRMILHDFGIARAEAFLRDALNLDEGSYVSQVPSTLQEFGLARPYAYRNDLTVEALIDATQLSPAVAFVKAPQALAGHALLVDTIAESFVCIRDPLPQGVGKAYCVAVEDFLSFWLRPKTNRGQAVIVLE